MKAICTSYSKTDKGLILRNNWTEKLKGFTHLTEFLENFKISSNHYEVGRLFRAYELKRSFVSNIIEGEMELDNVVVHIRIVI